MQENMLLRLSHFIKSKNLSIRAFEQNSGLSNATISRAIKNGTSFSTEHLEKISNAFPELNLHWLIKGEGEMVLYFPLNQETPKPVDSIDAIIQQKVEEALQKKKALA